MADSDDDLSHTATDHARGKPAVSEDASAETLPATPDAKRDSVAKVLPDKIGKYSIERELGAGGMGVVYVAFDPDLERRIALKVLRAATSSEAAQRLQREARAMARLKHGNVVTVHEVATAGGRDYVAMELVEGESLAEWLKEAKRSQTEILDAFVQAGRGLAAAHAAGIVHRDFKPHNVLRDRAGRVLVTDFGLAREAHGEAGDPLAVTMPLAADASTSGASKSSSLSGLTVTGALLGTPAYMAPEQWTGGAVTPATDQFAYCVALWEAIVGTRPFTGPTVDMLRAQIIEGSSELDGSKLPKELRAPLLRGLDADPKKRWPSVDALLAAITPRKASPWFPVRALMAAGALVVATLVLITVRGQSSTSPAAGPTTCPPPLMTVETAWTSQKRATLEGQQQTIAVEQLDANAKAWSVTRATACAAAPDVRPAMLACLDGVMGRFDTAVAAVTTSASPKEQLEAGAVLVDPSLCVTAHPPKLVVPSQELREALAMKIALDSSVKQIPDARFDALATKVKTDPCAAMYANAFRAQVLKDSSARREAADLSEQGAERCTDDRARADGALVLLDLEFRNEFGAVAVRKKLRQAEIAVDLVKQPDLDAELDDARATIATRSDDIEHALIATDAATIGFAARLRAHDELDMALQSIAFRQLRATPDDLADMKHRLDALRTRAVALFGATSDHVRRVDQTAAYWAFAENDVVGSHARLAKLQVAEPITSPITASGKVVDAKGAPVAGATVVAGGYFVGDEVSVALADPTHEAWMRSMTTGPDGTFVLESIKDGIVVAQLGDQRSFAVATGENLVLPLRPTSHIEGTVDLHGLPSVRALVAFIPDGQNPLARYATATAVAPDGSFRSDGVTRGKQKIDVIVNGLLGQTVGSVSVDVNRPSITNIQLVAPSSRTLYVVLRSSVGQPLANAQVLIQSGTVTATNLQELRSSSGSAVAMRIALPVLGDKVPPEVRAVAKDGDLYVAVTGAPTGDASACAIPLPADLSERANLQRLVEANITKVPTACKPVAPDAKVLLEDVPPWPRLE